MKFWNERSVYEEEVDRLILTRELSAKTIPREQSEREEDTKAAARNSIRVWKLGLCEVGFGEYSFFVWFGLAFGFVKFGLLIFKV